MRTRDDLDRLAAAGRPLLSAAELLVDAGEEERILGRIVSTPRPAAPTRQPSGLRRAVVLAAVAVLAAAALAATELHQRGGSPALGGQRLTGAALSLAGYRFRTPAGFEDSSVSCGPSATDRFAAAASADGGCVEAFFMLSSGGSPLVPAGAEPVGVGAYQGHLVSQGDPQWLVLYVDLPELGDTSQDVVIRAQGLTAEQLVAVAESGLPATPSATVG